MLRAASWLLVIAPVATASCLATGEDDADSAGAFSISVSAADTALVLDLVNYPGTDHRRLDIDAALDTRAAAAIVLYRDGLDRHSPSPDDDSFDDLAELDAVKWVGDAALSRLVAFARAHPAPASVTVEGVAFAGWEAEAVVWGVNHATQTELDVDAALDARAASALVATAPHPDLAHVAAAAYVGPAALRALVARALVWWPRVHTPDPEPCAVALADRADPVVADFTRLVAIATTLDWPFGEVVAMAVPSCVDVDDPAQAGAVIAALVATPAINWGYGPEVRPAAGAFAPGGSTFIPKVGDTAARVDDMVSEARWTPTTPDEIALYDNLPAMVAALTAGPAANLADFAEVRLRIEAAECSQTAVALIQRSTGRIWIAHTFPGC